MKGHSNVEQARFILEVGCGLAGPETAKAEKPTAKRIRRALTERGIDFKAAYEAIKGDEHPEITARQIIWGMTVAARSLEGYRGVDAPFPFGATHEEVLDDSGAMDVQTPEEAAAMFERIVEHDMRAWLKPREEAEADAMSNIGHWSGFYDRATMARVLRLYQTEHLGKETDVGPEAALKAEMEASRKRQGEKNAL